MKRVLEIEHGCFTPLVFSIYGGMGREGRTYDRLADLLAEKKKGEEIDNDELDSN